jgi:hypothetical protein
MTTELFIDKYINKTDETLHDECIFKALLINEGETTRGERE